MRFALFRRVPADPPHLEVPTPGSAFQVALRRRPTAKRITLRVSNATGEVVLTIPERTDLDTAQRFADRHGDWIADPARQGAASGSASRPAPWCPCAACRTGSSTGRAIRGVTQRHRDRDGEPIIAVTGEPPHVARRVRDFLEARGQAAISPRA